MALKLPHQGSIDRSIPLSSYMLTVAIADETGKIIEKLSNPVGGPHGSMPGDPAWFRSNVDPRIAVCQILSARGAMYCMRSRGYF